MHLTSVLPLGDTLDVRSAREFAIGHFASAVSLPLPELVERRYLLPPSKRTFSVFGDDDDAAQALEWLHANGFANAAAHSAMFPGAAPSSIVTSPWTAAPESVRLWQPSPFLEEVLAELPEPPPAARALDVACGSGRESTTAALLGYDVTGVDVLADALDRAEKLWQSAAAAASAHVRTRPRFVVADVEREWPATEKEFALILCFRFLSRPSFAAMAASLAPGGTLVYQTFTKAQARHGKPTRPEHLLRPGELRGAFADQGLRIERYREDDPPDGPALASLWATRP